jgi:hypothetical protein
LWFAAFILALWLVVFLSLTLFYLLSAEVCADFKLVVIHG